MMQLGWLMYAIIGTGFERNFPFSLFMRFCIDSRVSSQNTALG
jgi:hypothetical protein